MLHNKFLLSLVAAVTLTCTLSYASQELLDCYATGGWRTPLVDWELRSTQTCTLKYRLGKTAVQNCLKGKWVYILGDSSCRMFFSALVEKANGTLQDWRFGSYKEHVKGGCTGGVEEKDGHRTIGCLREYFGDSIRMTFGFQAYGQHQNEVFKSLVSDSQQPDLMLVETGAWALSYGRYYNHSYTIQDIVNQTYIFLDHIRSVYQGPIVWLGLPACGIFRDDVKKLHVLLKPAILQYGNSSVTRAPSPLYLDRQSSTEMFDDLAICEGFHPFGNVTLLHLNMLLNIYCGTG
jgi:hypothetical protein